MTVKELIELLESFDPDVEVELDVHGIEGKATDADWVVGSDGTAVVVIHDYSEG